MSGKRDIVCTVYVQRLTAAIAFPCAFFFFRAILLNSGDAFLSLIFSVWNVRDCFSRHGSQMAFLAFPRERTATDEDESSTLD